MERPRTPKIVTTVSGFINYLIKENIASKNIRKKPKIRTKSQPRRKIPKSSVSLKKVPKNKIKPTEVVIVVIE